MSTRAAIKAAANTVDGITAHEYLVPAIDPGTLYPRLARVEYPNKFGGVTHWNVVLVLPQDLAEADRYLEDTLPGLRAALTTVLPITSVTVQRLDITGVGVLPVAFFNGHTGRSD